MKNLTRNRFWFIAVLVFSCKFCFAQPSGEFTLDFDNSTPLLDMNGTFQVTDQILGAGNQVVPLSFGVDITHDSHGALHASGTTAIVQIQNDFLAATCHASGRISGGGARPVQVFLSVRLAGQGTVGGLDTRFTISVAYHLTFNPNTGALEGSSRGSATLSQLGGGRIRSDDISVGLPGGGDGSWQVAMNVIPFQHLSGSAAIILSGGRQINGALSGSYSPRSGISALRFTGTNVDRGASANFSFSTVEGVTELETARGTILGQRVLF